jgi:hypothetical protein
MSYLENIYKPLLQQEYRIERFAKSDKKEPIFPLLDSILHHVRTFINPNIKSHVSMIFEIYDTCLLNAPLHQYHYAYINCWNNSTLTDIYLAMDYIVLKHTNAIPDQILGNIVSHAIKYAIGLGAHFDCFWKAIKKFNRYTYKCNDIYLMNQITYLLIEEGYDIKSGIIYKNDSIFIKTL